MRPSALISCASFQNEAQRGPRVASEASDSGPRSWRASPPAEGSGRTDDSSQFTISSHRHTADLAAVMPLAYNIALLIYVRFIGRLAKLPIILRLALCDRWLVFERIPRSFVWMLHCAGARWCCRAMCSLEYRNAVRPLGAFMCVSLCLRSE